MKTNMFKLAAVTASVAVAALLASDLSASAQEQGYGPMSHRAYHARPMTHSARAEARYHRTAQVDGYRPLTVGRAGEPAYVPAAPGYNPYAGPGAIVTGPIAFGATLASLPFRALAAIFPYDAHDPRVVVGAPLHFAGRLVQAPFAIAQAPFGGPGPFVDTAY